MSKPSDYKPTASCCRFDYGIDSAAGHTILLENDVRTIVVVIVIGIKCSTNMAPDDVLPRSSLGPPSVPINTREPQNLARARARQIIKSRKLYITNRPRPSNRRLGGGPAPR